MWDRERKHSKKHQHFNFVPHFLLYSINKSVLINDLLYFIYLNVHVIILIIKTCVVSVSIILLFIMSDKFTEVCSSVSTAPCHPRPKNVCVRAGEMVALQCPRGTDSNTEVRLIWSRATDQDRVLTNMTADEQQQRSMSVHRGSLVILSASVEHEGKYSCTVG